MYASLSLLCNIDPGDVCILWGNIVHKFMKAPCSVTLAANSVSGFDMRRMATAYAHFSNDMVDMIKSGSFYRVSTCPTTGLSYSIREEWEPSFHAGIRNGCSILSILLPWILRSLDNGVDVSNDTYMFINNIDQQNDARTIDSQERDLRSLDGGHNRWSNTLNAITTCYVVDSGVSATQWSTHCAANKLVKWWLQPTPDEDCDVDKAFKEYTAMRDGLIEWGTSFGRISSHSSELGLIISPATPRREMKSIEYTYYSESECKQRATHPYAASNRGTITNMYGSIQFIHSKTGGAALAPGWTRNDNGFAYVINGGAMRSSLHAANGGGMASYTAKYADVDLGIKGKPGLAVTNSYLPYFNIPYHRESWSTTSINMYVGFDHLKYKKLIDAREHYRAQTCENSSDNDTSDDSKQKKRYRV
jgi:hypothetical protein